MKSLYLALAYLILSGCSTTHLTVDKGEVFTRVEDEPDFIISKPNIEFKDGFLFIKLDIDESKPHYRIDHVTEEVIDKDVSSKGHFIRIFSSVMLLGIPTIVSIVNDEFSMYDCPSNENGSNMGVRCTSSWRNYNDNVELGNQSYSIIKENYSFINLTIEREDGSDLFIPVNEFGAALVSLQELGFPEEIELKISYQDESEDFEFPVPEYYLQIANDIKSNDLFLYTEYSDVSKSKFSEKETFRKLNSRLNWSMNDYLNIPLPKVIEPVFNKLEDEDFESIAKPNLPPSPKLMKSQFETKSQFEARVQESLETRDEQIEEIQKVYRDRVEKRNSRVTELIENNNRENNIKVDKYNSRRKFLLENHNQRLSTLKKYFNDQERFQISLEFKKVMGKPSLTDFHYDAENEVLYGEVAMSNSEFTEKIAVKIPPEVAKSAHMNLSGVDLNMIYDLSDLASISLKRVELSYDDNRYVGQATEELFKSEEIQVVINADKIINEYESVSYSDFGEDISLLNKKLNLSVSNELQNPNLVDRFHLSTTTYVSTQNKAHKISYNDDLPREIAKIKTIQPNKNRWLFVIGIEEYKGTDDIIYAERSAQLFSKAMQKKLGIPRRNVYELINGGASYAQIKDRMRLMLKNVDKGDEIYFYYNGHGIPVPSQNNEPYILASDKVPDFVSDDDFFKLKNIYTLLSNSKADKVYAFIDSCFSGVTDGRSVFKGVAASRLAPKSVKFDRNKMVVLTAGTKTQFSNMYEDKGHRLFTYHLIKELIKEEGSINNLYKKVKYKVKAESRDMGDLMLQEPQLYGKSSFPI